jgi:hypothetical protein
MGRERGLANKIRAGLESSQTSLRVVEPIKRDVLDDVFYGKPIGRHVREFGALFATLCLIYGCIKAWSHPTIMPTLLAVILAAIFAFLGYMQPRILYPIWKAWMKLAHVLSLVMTTVLLSLMWFGTFVPMAFLLRILKVKVMDLTHKTTAKTYWENRDEKYHDFKRLEQQY